jgi:hypothetical protein
MGRELGHSFHSPFQSFFLSSGVLFFLSLMFCNHIQLFNTITRNGMSFFFGGVQIYGDGDMWQDAEAAGD